MDKPLLRLICGILSIGLVACSSLPQPVLTPVPPTALPAKQSASPPAPQVNTVSPLQTATPLAQPTATNTPLPCPPFSIDTALPTPDIPDNYIGRHYSNLPNGYTLLVAQLINDGYALTHMSRGKSHIFWLEKLICHNESGKAFYEIRAVLSLSPTDNQVVADFCHPIAGDNADVLGIGFVPEPGGLFTQTNRAWRVNTLTESFDEISPLGIKCFKEIMPVE